MFTAQALTHNNTHTTSGSPSTRKFGTFSSFLFLIFPALGSESQDFCLLNCVTAGRKIKSDVLPQVYCSPNLQKQLKLRVLEDPTTKQESSCDIVMATTTVQKRAVITFTAVLSEFLLAPVVTYFPFWMIR